ncbi:MAG: hypothetical protein WBQ18_01065 [Solirubrobacteraceae bacterium]
MSSELDLTRLTELQALLGAELPDIVATLVTELDTALRAVEFGVAEGDLGAVAFAAHSARNSALMVNARPMLERLTVLETSARRDDLPAARAAQADMLGAWEPLRRSLQDAGGAAP